MRVIKDSIPYDERKTLETICRHHGITNPDAIRDLERFAAWIRELERDKTSLNRVPQAPFSLSFLSSLGIYGKEALDG